MTCISLSLYICNTSICNTPDELFRPISTSFLVLHSVDFFTKGPAIGPFREFRFSLPWTLHRVFRTRLSHMHSGITEPIHILHGSYTSAPLSVRLYLYIISCNLCSFVLESLCPIYIHDSHTN
jgi:hypothetical protein